MIRSYEEVISDTKNEIKGHKNLNMLIRNYHNIFRTDPRFGLWMLNNYGYQIREKIVVLYLSGRYDFKSLGERIIRHNLELAKQEEDRILNLELDKPRCDLNEDLVKEERRGKVSYYYDFLSVTHKIEKAYKFKTRGVFDFIRAKTLTLEKELMKEDMGLKKKEIEHGYLGSPILDETARIYSIFGGAYSDDLLPYVDHWLYLLDHDFCDVVVRGGFNYMNIKAYEDEDPIFAKFREIYALECDLASDGNTITFYIDW